MSRMNRNDSYYYYSVIMYNSCGKSTSKYVCDGCDTSPLQISLLYIYIISPEALLWPGDGDVVKSKFPHSASLPIIVLVVVALYASQF